MDSAMNTGFQYSGTISASKSLLNRMLIIQSFDSSLEVNGNSRCDDVRYMKEGLRQLLGAKSNPIDCGAAGTVFRFIALRASRIPGQHTLLGTQKLFSRPHKPLVDILRCLGVSGEFTSEGFVIEGSGWKKPLEPVTVDCSLSSQFASAVLLNSWNLDFDLGVKLDDCRETKGLSAGYLEMTEKVLMDAGLCLHRENELISIGKRSRVLRRKIDVEMDVSSAFAISAMGALGGKVEIGSFPNSDLQPDSVFTEILEAMNVPMEKTGGSLSVYRSASLRPVSWDIGKCPDLFPVLAVLCAFADGCSYLYGAPHLVYKESNRISGVERLLTELGCKFEARVDGMKIYGPLASSSFENRFFCFDPEDDHRLAMAAALAKVGGASLDILHPEVVNKSFPEFWNIFSEGMAVS